MVRNLPPNPAYQWLEGGVQIATGRTATVNLGVGSHTITLRATDDQKAISEDQVNIQVNKRGRGRKVEASASL